MLSREAVTALLDSGNATLADVAAQFNVSLNETYEFCRQHGISEPTLASPSSHRIQRLLGVTTHPQPVPWERLLSDDADGHVINGIDTRVSGGNVNANEIIRFYHGGCTCRYSGRPTELVMAADANQANFLVSNLIPVAADVLDRFKESVPLAVEHTYRMKPYGSKPYGPSVAFVLTVTVESRLDGATGTASNGPYVSASVDRWVRPYVERVPLDTVLPHGLPATPELLAVWLWRQLATKALLKGLATLRVEASDRPTVLLTKQAMLFQTKQLLQRRFGQRSIVTARPPVQPTPIITP